jgi:hypothetical protein
MIPKKKDVKAAAVTKLKHLLEESEKNYEKLKKKPAPARLELVTSLNKLGVSPLGQ